MDQTIRGGVKEALDRARERTRSATSTILVWLLRDPEFVYVSRLRARARAGVTFTSTSS